MMMKGKSIHLLVALLLVGLTSCDVQEISFVKLDKVEINKIEQKELFLDVTVQLDNPNSFSVKVLNSDLDLYLEDKYIGKAELGNNFTIEKGGVKPYDLSIVAKGENLNVQLLPIMLSAALTGKVKTRLDGSIKGKAFFISKSVPIDITETVQLSNNSK